MSQVIVRLPIEWWAEGRRILVEFGPVVKALLGPVYVVSEPQASWLRDKGIPFEQLTPEQLNTLKKEENQMSVEERNKIAEGLIRALYLRKEVKPP